MTQSCPHQALLGRAPHQTPEARLCGGCRNGMAWGVSCGHSAPGLQMSSCDTWGESHLTPCPGQGPAWAEREGHT